MYDSPSTVVALSYVQSWLLLFGELTVNMLYDVTSRSPSHLNPGLLKIIHSSPGNRDVANPIAEVCSVCSREGSQISSSSRVKLLL